MVATALWLALLAPLVTLPPHLPALWWAVAALMVLAEVVAPAIPRFGFLSVSAPLVVVLAPAPGAAGFFLTLALLARSLRHGRPEATGRALEAAADALPALVALELVARWPQAAVPAALLWVALSQMVPGILAAGLSAEETAEWLRGRAQVRGAQVGLLFPLAVFPYLPVWQALALFPVLLGMQTMVGRPVAERFVQKLGARLEVEKARGVDARLGQEKMRLLAVRRAEELAGLERLTRALTRSEALETTMEAVLDLVMRVAPPARSVVLFLRQDGGLQPAAVRTPHAARVRDAVLLKLREPVLDELAAGGGPVYRTDAQDDGRVFPGEISLAIALEDEGVLYVGTPDRDGFSEEMREFLGVVAGQGVVALQSARRLESERREREQHHAARTRLERWVQRLGLLLDGVGALTSTLDAEQLARRLEAMLHQVVPHQAGMVVFQDGPVHLWGGTQREASLGLAQTVMTNGRPLLLERRRDARLAPLTERSESLVSVPLLVESTCVGAIGLTRPDEGAFAREDQDLLQLVGYLAAVAFANTRRQVQLAQANKLAAVGQLAAGVAHELNSPLGAILLATESALMKSTPNKLERIRQATVRAQKIVANLLIYCQGGQPAATEPVDLGDAIDQALDSVPVRVERRLRPGVRMEANVGQLVQVLVNLLSNARDAMGPDGTVLLESWVDGERACLAVHDNGPGVSEELSQRIFEPFFTTRDVGHGTGLGLSICHQLLSQQNGTVELVRDGRPGARFVITLPSR